jgi:hypothetical protein
MPGPVAAHDPLAETVGPLDAGYLETVKPKRRISRWILGLVGYGVSAIVGLGLGYFLIKWLFPGSHLPSLW